MTNTNQTENKYGFTDFEYAYLANRFAEEGNMGDAKRALGRVKSGENDGLLLENSEYFRTDQGAAEAAQIYAGAYQKGLFKLNVSDLYEFYSGQTGFLSEEEKATWNSVLEKYGDQNFGKIRGAYFSALDDINGSKDGRLIKEVSKYKEGDEEREKEFRRRLQKAEKTTKKYDDLMKPVLRIEKIRSGSLEEKLHKEVLKKMLTPQEQSYREAA